MRSLGKYGIHALAWTFLYLLPYASSFERMGDLRSVNGGITNPIHILSTLLLIAFTYVNYYALLPRLYLQQRHLLYFAAVLAGLFLVVELPVLLARPPMPPPHGLPPVPHHPHGPHHEGMLPGGRTYNFILFLLIVFGSISLHTRLQLLSLQQEKTDAELAFLKAQVHPHFLFNALNGIYSLALNRSPKTPEAVLQLSGLMRYLLNEAREDVVPLEQELNYLDNYVRLQQMRLGDTMRVDYVVEGDPAGLRIAPLLLLPFVENAFKHGVNPDADAQIRISVRVSAGVLYLMVMNRKVSEGERSESSGIGLPNVRARLAQLYPGRFDLQTDDGADIYAINLTIHL